MIRVLVCHPSEGARTALRRTLGGHVAIAVVGEAGTGPEAVAAAVALSPDVALVHVAMPLLGGPGTAERIRRLPSGARVVALAGCSDPAAVPAMLEAGASASCVEDAPLWALEQAIAGASEPLVRLAHLLAQSASAAGAAEIAARELAELSGGAAVAVYLAAPGGLSLAGFAGGGCRERIAVPPAAAVRAFGERAASWARAPERSELARLGVPCVEAVAVPLVSHGEKLGVLLAGMPPQLDLVLDLDLVAAVADLLADSLADVRRLPELVDAGLDGLADRRACHALGAGRAADSVVVQTRWQ